ncbi:unnamed protein product [Meloidogyne enterolobii]|uniref:Uncharacterized protein n=1 Tax=Meloidogyne enterolobii TaxID=390850 RepID=A0ACB0YI53_MELEN
MKLFLINILSLFLLLNFKFGGKFKKSKKIFFLLTDTIKCYKEFDLETRTEVPVITKLTTCDTEQISEQIAEKVPEEVKEQVAGIKLKCIKSDCGEYGYYKSCGICAIIKFIDRGLGFKKGDCTCYECDTDYCNSAGGVLSNLKIIALFCLTTMIINGKSRSYYSENFRD